MIILYLIWIFLICYLSSFFSQIPNQSYLVISVTISEGVKEWYKVNFTIMVYTSIENYKIRIIDFGRKITLRLVFIVHQLRNITCKWLLTIKSKLHSSFIFSNPTFNLSSHCQQVSTRRGVNFIKLSVILLYFGEAK